MMKVIAKDVVIGDSIVWKDRINDDTHVYKVESVGRSYGGDGTFCIFTLVRTVDQQTIERRNVVCEENELVDTPEPNQPASNVGSDPAPTEPDPTPESTSETPAE